MCIGFLSVLRGHSSYRARRSATTMKPWHAGLFAGFAGDTSGDGSRVNRHCFDLPPLGFYREANRKTCDCYRGLANRLVVLTEWEQNNGCFMAIKLWRSGYVTGHLKADGDFLLTVFCCQQLKDPQRRRVFF